MLLKLLRKTVNHLQCSMGIRGLFFCCIRITKLLPMLCYLQINDCFGFLFLICMCNYFNTTITFIYKFNYYVSISFNSFAYSWICTKKNMRQNAIF